MKVFSSILIFLITIVAIGQKMPSDYFDEASKFYQQKEYDKALESYQYVVNNHPKNELYPRAFYNIGYIHFIQEDYDKAIAIFKAIIESNFNEKENLGGGIMDDPYTNYRHRASRLLSNIYYNKNRFDTSLYYLSLSDTTYSYLNFCGNEKASNRVHTALKYADIFQKLNQPNKAIEQLLQAVFITLADNSPVLEELKNLLADKKGLKKELDNSLKKIYSRSEKNKDYIYTNYYLKFLNVEIDLPNRWQDEHKKFRKRKVIKRIKQTDFYKMIEQI